MVTFLAPAGLASNRRAPRDMLVLIERLRASRGQFGQPKDIVMSILHHLWAWIRAARLSRGVRP